MSSVNFSNAYFWIVDLNGANLNGANLQLADGCGNVYFNNADLSYADFTGLNMGNTYWNFAGSTWYNTIWTDGIAYNTNQA